jgi:hypothetical protein
MCGRFYIPFQALDWIVGQLPEHRQAWLDPETPVEMPLKIVEPAAAGLASYQCASPKRDVRPTAP